MNKRVLILGASAVQLDAVLQLKKMGCQTYVCAMAKDGPAAYAADNFEEINILDKEKVTNYIMANKIDIVYSVGSDLAIPMACSISEQLGLPHFVSANTAFVCNRKNYMRETLSNRCKGNIPFQVMEVPETIKIDFPVILKPSDSQGQRGIYLVNSQQEMEKHFYEAKDYSREGKVIVEKYICGQEYSVNGYMVNGKIRYLVPTLRETWPEYVGLIHKHVITKDLLSTNVREKIISIAENACMLLGIQNGPVYFQMKIEEDSPYIIEVTPRLDGCHMWNLLMRATGINLMKLCFEHLLYNNTSELNNIFNEIKDMELVFYCQEPNTEMDKSKFLEPDDVLDLFYYYKTGDYIREVNGVYEKVGYFIRNL